ncbi:hypothetical protein JCM5296_001361 [Sporobolomyces johnsonii]
MPSTLCIPRLVFLHPAPSNRAVQACARSYRLAGLAMLTSVPQSQTVNASSSPSSSSASSSSSTPEQSPSSNHEQSQLDDPAQPGLSEFVARVEKQNDEAGVFARTAEQGRRGGGGGGDEGERKLRRGPGAKEKERHKVKVCDKACANCKKKSQQPTSW